MAHTQALKKQKEKAEIEIATLEKIQTETRHLIQKTFDSAVKALVASMKGSIKDQVMKELRPMLKEELADVMTKFSTELVTAAGDKIKKEIQSASVLHQEPSSGHDAGTIPTKIRLRNMHHGAPQNARGVMRGNFAQKSGVKEMTAKRQSRVVKDAGNLLAGSPQGSRNVGLHGSDEATFDLSRKDGSFDLNIKPCGSNGYKPLSEFDTSDGVSGERLSNQLPGKGDSYRWRAVFATILESPRTDFFMGIVILVNAICIGAETDFSARYAGNKLPWVFDALDASSMVIFTAELLLKIYVHRGDMLRHDLSWNLFDTLIVVFQICETSMTSLSIKVFPGGFKVLRVVRIIRILRLLRLIRLIKLMRIFMELRMISNLLIDTGRSLCGTLIVLLVVLFIVGVCLTEEVVLARDGVDGSPVEDLIGRDVLNNFGTLDATMMSLFKSTTSGVMWGRYAGELTSEVSVAVGALYYFYIAFFTFAMANVITGIFVKQSMEAAQESQDDAMVQQINALFNKQDGCGDFTYEEFSRMIKMPEMAALFKAINIDSSEAPLLYRLLDENNDGTLDYEEFINGALRLRGPAKSLELAMFIKDTGELNRWTSKKIDSISGTMETVSVKIQETHDRIASMEDSALMRDSYMGHRASIPPRQTTDPVWKTGVDEVSDDARHY
eukprot:TRINITY_DN3832_c0_g1_i1.p1 TRINITY_DN3832_c0_g1~~TRINITY_DN3832_c0_g1_i1.p1  ORF type:complete len:703 (-),score=141.90 TRINITY_DN3832_c0_g1_i1:411-2414(-)